MSERTLSFQSVRKGFLDSLFWAVFWAVLGIGSWLILDSFQTDAYKVWGISSFWDFLAKAEHVSYFEDTLYELRGGICFRFFLETFVSVCFFGGLALSLLFDFIYDPTETNTIEFSDEFGDTMEFSRLHFPFATESSIHAFDRILSVGTSQTTLQLLTGTGDLHIAYLVLKGETHETRACTIHGIEDPDGAVLEIKEQMKPHDGYEVLINK